MDCADESAATGVAFCAGIGEAVVIVKLEDVGRCEDERKLLKRVEVVELVKLVELVELVKVIVLVPDEPIFVMV